MTEEEWKVIDGFDSDYMISNCGRVWSNKTQKILTPFLNESGYYKLTLRENGRNRGVLLHRLIALAFIPNPESKPTVNHINEIKTDNRIENLEWATVLEQNIHGTRIQRAVAHTDWKAVAKKRDYVAIAAKHDYYNMNNKSKKPVAQYDADGHFIASFSGLCEAGRCIGRDYSSIRSAIIGRCRHCGGYQWRWYDGDRSDISPLKRKECGQKAVIKMDLGGRELERFPSIKKAAESVGVHFVTLSRCINGRIETVAGFRWKAA